ncbi:MAG TPA: SHOCT domain-containing protein [Polyangia bacterium]|nr:SHOCT domain-containing protein [Polyangia bacterium]
MRKILRPSLALVCLVAVQAQAQESAKTVGTPPAAGAVSSPAPGLTTLRLMRDKGLISAAEYDAALRDLGEPTGAGAAAAPVGAGASSSKAPFAEFMSLRLLRDKGILSAEEYDNAVRGLSASVAPTVASAPPAPPAPPKAVPAPPKVPTPHTKHHIVELTTMRMLHEKGIISDEEYDAALRDFGQSIGDRGADATTLVIAKIATTIYGFVQADVIYNTTQSFNEFAGNLQVARPGTFAAGHSRLQFTVRDSRFGFRLQAPETKWVRASALLEMDFLGAAGTGTEAAFFNNPVLRIRHAYLKVDTPIFDILFGQYWHLFGWQPNYIPADVQWSGVVGSLFSRTTQLRLSKAIKTKHVTIDVAVAGMRPPERDSSTPELQAGVRLAFPKWTAVHTIYVTATSTSPASIGVSGDVRRFSVPEFSATPQRTNARTSLGIAVDGFLPIIRGTKEKKDNSLALIGEYVEGQSINDLYVGLNGGVTNANLPGGGTFTTTVDPGLAVYDVNGRLRAPHWRTFIVGIEYYLPHVGGRVGLFANYSHTRLLDAKQYANPARVRDNESFYNAGIFADLTQAIRVGVDWAYYDDRYADGMRATANAIQGTGFFFF